MAQNANRSSNPNTSSRTYPGTATRVLPPPTPPRPNTLSTTTSAGGLGSVPTVFLRPLSRSQLAPQINGTHRSRSPPSPPIRPISLETPRPNNERHRNLYMGAPLPSHHHTSHHGTPRTTTTSSNSSQSHTHQHPNHHSTIPQNSTNPPPVHRQPRSSSPHAIKLNRTNSTITAAEQVRLPTSSSRKLKHFLSDNCSPKVNNVCSQGVVTAQPRRANNNSPLSLLLEECSGKETHGEHESRLNDHGPPLSISRPESSIVCPYCRKCRCEACATPRPLPSTWICSKSVKCGPEPCLDYTTCLCCVKALFYHCGKNHEADGGVLCADQPCSCAPHRKFWRWGCMAGMSIFLPCLCFYWPCKGALCLVEKAYQKVHSNGCQCKPSKRPTVHHNSLTLSPSPSSTEQSTVSRICSLKYLSENCCSCCCPIPESSNSNSLTTPSTTSNTKQQEQPHQKLYSSSGGIGADGGSISSGDEGDGVHGPILLPGSNNPTLQQHQKHNQQNSHCTTVILPNHTNSSSSPPNSPSPRANHNPSVKELNRISTKNVL